MTQFGLVPWEAVGRVRDQGSIAMESMSLKEVCCIQRHALWHTLNLCSVQYMSLYEAAVQVPITFQPLSLVVEHPGCAWKIRRVKVWSGETWKGKVTSLGLH